MFTIEQIENAHSKVKSGADFPNYIQEIKKVGVTSFETWVKDSHTEYFGEDGSNTVSKAQYEDLMIGENPDEEVFVEYLKAHQKGKTDYITFCRHCAETGIEKWRVDINAHTCTYFDKKGNEILKEDIPH